MWRHFFFPPFVRFFCSVSILSFGFLSLLHLQLSRSFCSISQKLLAPLLFDLAVPACIILCVCLSFFVCTYEHWQYTPFVDAPVQTFVENHQDGWIKSRARTGFQTRFALILSFLSGIENLHCTREALQVHHPNMHACVLLLYVIK